MINKRLIPVVLLTFVNTIGFSILIPVLPFVTDQYGEGPLVYGVLISAYALFQFLAAPLIGSLSDKYGRRPTLILSQAGTLVSWLIFGAAYFVPTIQIGSLALPIIVIMLSRVIDGITGGNVSVTNAYVADISTAKQRTKYYSITGATMGLGFIIGPAIGGYSASFGVDYLGTAIAAAAISLITLILIVAFLSESLTKEDLDHKLEIKFWHEINFFGKLKKFTADPELKDLFRRKAFFAVAMAAFTSTFALYAKDILNLDARQLGLLMVIIGGFSIFNQVVVIHRVAKKFGNLPTFHFGQILLAISILLLVFRPNLVWFTIIMYLTNLGISLSMPTFKTMITNKVSNRQQGQITGLDESLMAGSNGVIPVIAGAIYGALSVSAFAIFAGVLFVPYLLFGFWQSDHR